MVAVVNAVERTVGSRSRFCLENAACGNLVSHVQITIIIYIKELMIATRGNDKVVNRSHIGRYLVLVAEDTGCVNTINKVCPVFLSRRSSGLRTRIATLLG